MTNILHEQKRSSRYAAVVSMPCPICETIHTLSVTQEEQLVYALMNHSSESLQDLFPQLNAGEREFIRSGYCGECQKLMFGSDLLAESARYDDYEA